MNNTSSATSDSWCIAFKPDKTIYWCSNSAATVINRADDADSNGATIYIKNGVYVLNGSQPLSYLGISTVLHVKTGLSLIGESANERY